MVYRADTGAPVLYARCVCVLNASRVAMRPRRANRARVMLEAREIYTRARGLFCPAFDRACCGSVMYYALARHNIQVSQCKQIIFVYIAVFLLFEILRILVYFWDLLR